MTHYRFFKEQIIKAKNELEAWNKWAALDPPDRNGSLMMEKVDSKYKEAHKGKDPLSTRLMKKQLEKEAEDRKERDCECKCHKEESK